MFKNKKKIDSRIRFQNSRFTRKLESARSYKRTTRILPKNPREVFLAGVGLSSWTSKLATGLILLLLIYIVYIPNFIFIKKISISGGDTSVNSTVEAITNSYLEKRLPWPQKNIILLSKNSLKNYLIGNDQRVLSIDKITKHFPNSLIITYTQRVDKFLIQTASSTGFTISNDGITTSEVIPDASGTLPNLSILIKLDSGEDLVVGQTSLSKQLINFINGINDRLATITKSPVDYYQMQNLESTDISIYTKSGYKILFDSNADLNETLNQLSLLFSQFSDGEQKKLFYIDMRFSGKSYVCEKDTPCVKDINLPQNSTTTPNTIN